MKRSDVNAVLVTVEENSRLAERASVAYGVSPSGDLRSRWLAAETEFVASFRKAADILLELAAMESEGVKIQIFRDGLHWCAVGEDFENLQVSSAGHGGTVIEAVSDLMSVKPFQDRVMAYATDYERREEG